MTDWYVPPSDLVRQIVEQQYPAEDRSAVIDALATILSEDGRNTILVLAYGDTARLLRLVEVDHNDYRDICQLLQNPRAELRLPGDFLIRGVDRGEYIRRCQVLGLPAPLTTEEFEWRRLEDSVKRFVAAELLFPSGQLQVTTRLHHDLGLAGSDGSKFMASFAERFGVDLQDFRAESYFPPKPGEQGIANLLKYVFRQPAPTIVPITIDQLIQAVKTKKWNPAIH